MIHQGKHLFKPAFLASISQKISRSSTSVISSSHIHQWQASLFTNPSNSISSSIKCNVIHSNLVAGTSVKSLQRFCSNQADSKVVEFLLADIGEGIQEVVVREWFVKVGDIVQQFDNICEVQSDKASVTISSRYDGVVEKLHYKVDETAYVGKPLIAIVVKKDGDSMAVGEEVGEQEAIPVAEEARSDATVQLPPSSSTATSTSSKEVLAIPMVRRYAAEHKVDLRQVVGTGRGGRILKEDVMKFMASKEGKSFPPQARPSAAPASPSPVAHAPATVPPPTPSAPAKAPLPVSPPVVFSKDRTEELKGVKKVMVKTMTESLKVPHFVYSEEIDITNLVMFKKILQKQAHEFGIKFSYLPMFVKAASLALMHYPVLNATVDKDCNNITYKASHNIGLAMDTSQGLIVPNVKGVQGKTLLEIAAEINRLQDLGLRGALTPNDLSHGTFTLSNIGSIGGTYCKAILMPNEVGIGALGKIQVLPRFSETGELIKAHVMQVSWSADHRVIDGATMARFSNMWKDLLEKPVLMSLYMK